MKDKMRLSDRIAQQVLDLIHSRQLQAGDKLPTERSLAEELGVSRTALREALHQLASRGIVQSRVGAGTFLRSLAPEWHGQTIAPLAPLLAQDPQYHHDVLEARQMLEAGAAWYAAQRATSADKDHIRRCLDELHHCQQRQDAEGAARADAQFHLAIAQASHNAVVLQVMRSLFELMLGTVAQSRSALFARHDCQALEQLSNQHQRIMQAVVDGQPEQARQAIGQHLGYVQQQLSEAEADSARQQRLQRFSAQQA